MLSDDFFRIVGRVTVYSADAQAVMCQVRLELGGQRVGLGAAIAKMLKSQSVAQCENKLSAAAEETSDAELRRALRGLILQSEALRNARNGITHAYWIRPPWGDPEFEPMSTRVRVDGTVAIVMPDMSVWESVAEGLEQLADRGRDIVRHIRATTPNAD
ncbi:MAG: hypothetical protein M3Q98_10100 [Actinomycetota bacterium]|nr:hypothetical protein [Actinomycetota bacterium]